MDNQENQVDSRKEVLAWEMSDHHDHKRGVAWYIFATLVVGFIISYSVATRNFLFAFIIIIFGVVMVTHSLKPTGKYRFAITQVGVTLNDKFYAWKDIESFWIVYEPPDVKMLYFEFSGLRPRLPINLGDVDPNEVRSILAEVVSEDLQKNDEPISDLVTRVFKI